MFPHPASPSRALLMESAEAPPPSPARHLSVTVNTPLCFSSAFERFTGLMLVSPVTVTTSYLATHHRTDPSLLCSTSGASPWLLMPPGLRRRVEEVGWRSGLTCTSAARCHSWSSSSCAELLNVGFSLKIKAGGFLPAPAGVGGACLHQLTSAPSWLVDREDAGVGRPLNFNSQL